MNVANDVQTRQENWEKMSPDLKKWFTGPPPGQPRTKNEEDFDKDPPDSAPVKSFAVVQMDVREVDYVDLVDNKRFLFSKNGLEWEEQPLNP